jgi:tetratricopeptide (TPR) repeat protein
MHAYEAGELDEASEWFHEATKEDPSYAWGWFNRGALESRRGELEAAAKSVGKAIELDDRHRTRACADADYTALAATQAGGALLECGYEEGC